MRSKSVSSSRFSCLTPSAPKIKFIKKYLEKKKKELKEAKQLYSEYMLALLCIGSVQKSD